MANCPDIGKGNVQRVFVEIEDTPGVLQKPTESGLVLPAGACTMTQAPEWTDSEELSESLNVLNRFQSAFAPGEVELTMYFRPVVGSSNYAGAPQGHSLLYALMGVSQLRDTVGGTLKEGISSSASSLAVSGMTAGAVIPPIGSLKTGSERIKYTSHSTSVVSSATVHTFGGLSRGYFGTTAAAHDASAEITLGARVYAQDVCRPTVSVWIEYDNGLVLFMEGCTVTECTIPLEQEGGQKVTFTLQGRRMGWCGRGAVASVSGAVVTLADAAPFAAGAYVQNLTAEDDNSGAGYAVTAVDDAAKTITLASAPSNWSASDVVGAFLPDATPRGEPAAAKSARVYVDGALSGRRDGELTISTPTSFAAEIGQEYPGDNADGKREISLSGSLYFRAADAARYGILRKPSLGELPVMITLGDQPGGTLHVFLPRVQFDAPVMSTDGEFLTFDQGGTALGDPDERDGESAIYMEIL